MAKRATTTRQSSPGQFGSERPQGAPSAAPQLGQQPGRAVQETKAQPRMTPQASAAINTDNDVGQVTRSMIAQRAYELWKSKGGSDLENWLKAEREVLSQNGASV